MSLASSLSDLFSSINIIITTIFNMKVVFTFWSVMSLLFVGIVSYAGYFATAAY